MRMVWIWAVLTWSCHQQHKGSTVAPEVEDDTDDPSHEGSDGSPDANSGGTESSDSGEVQTSDSGEVEPSDSGSPPLWPGSTEADRQAMVDSMVAAAQNFLASLDDFQRGQVQYGLDDAERSDWSNLPHAVYIRQGVSFGELSDERMAEIEEHLDDVSVAWMGSTEPGSMMYYRIQGSRMLIEFDHTRSADHIHAVYRDPVNDYGGDWLRKHLHDHHAGE